MAITDTPSWNSTRVLRCSATSADATTSQAFQIRRAALVDLGSLIELDRQVFGPDAYAPTKMAQLLNASPEILTLVAEHESKVVAYAVARIGSPDRLLPPSALDYLQSRDGRSLPARIGYLQSLAVADRAGIRRTGLGTTLVSMRLEWLSRRVVEVFALAWPAGHFVSLGARLGFRVLAPCPDKAYADGSVGLLCRRRRLGRTRDPAGDA